MIWARLNSGQTGTFYIFDFRGPPAQMNCGLQTSASKCPVVDAVLHQILILFVMSPGSACPSGGLDWAIRRGKLTLLYAHLG
jgi:hypothetical protein